MRKVLGPLVTIANPLDYHTYIWGDWQAMQSMFEAALTPQFDLALLVIDFPLTGRCDDADWRNAAQAFVAAVTASGACAAIVSSLPETMPEDLADDLMKDGIAPLSGLEEALAAAEAAAMIGKDWEKSAPSPLLSTCHSRASGNTSPPRADNSPLLNMDSRWRGNDKVELIVLDELQSKQELAAFGLVVPKGVALHADNEIGEAVSGYSLAPPFALKALGVAHKTEAGGVVLNLGETEDVQAALRSMSPLGDHFLLEEMAPSPDAELIVGVSRDPVIGLVMTIGAGGILAELLGDTATLLFPVSEADIHVALEKLKIGRILQGWRGAEATDIDALVANILCIANYAAANADILEELDVNPLFATQFGSVAVDALIVKRKTK